MNATLKLKPIGPNQNELILPNGNRIFFSYETPVAAFVKERGYIRSEKKYSVTTSRHINQWLGSHAYEIVSEYGIESLMECHKMFNE